MNDAVPEHDSVGTDHLCDGQRRGDLHRRDTGFFQFGRDRSAAARAGPSRGSQNNTVNPERLGLFRHFTADTARV